VKETIQHEQQEFDLADNGEYSLTQDGMLNTYVAEEIEAWQLARDITDHHQPDSGR
jgi:hypothetical protein